MTQFRLIRETPEFSTQIYSLFYAQDQDGNIYYAKIFSINKLQEYGLDEALQYNEQVLSDMDGMAFPDHINNISISIPNDGLFTFISQAYDTNLETYMKTTRITETEALRIFDNVLKAVYSVFGNGYWHKCIRPEHFVRIGNIWKLDSLVYSEDISKLGNLQTQYAWNPAYQPPQVYENDIEKFSDQDFLPIVVWNLGSLLLDLFFSVHKLHSYDVLKCYKGKKFSLENIKVKKNDLFSKKLKDILASMLHYDPKSRMKLQEVFSNEYLSKQVALLFKEKHKNSLAGVVKIFTGGKSALSSALMSKEQRQRGSKVLPINQVVKSAIHNLQAPMNKINALDELKKQNQEDTDQGPNQKPGIFSQFFAKEKISVLMLTSPNIFPETFSSLLASKQFSEPIKIYKTIFDKSEILTISGQKFSQINYSKNSQKQIPLISKYAVQVLSYMNLNKLLNEMNKNSNSMGLENKIFQNFKTSKQFQALKNIMNKQLQRKDQSIIKIRDQIRNLKQSERKITEESDIKAFLEINYKSSIFFEIKVNYRKIIKISYDTVTRQYNNDIQNEKLARLAMYIVYCLTIDKLYIPSLIEKNFLPYFEWANQKPSLYVPAKNLIKYFNEANQKVLVLHAKDILERFFKL